MKKRRNRGRARGAGRLTRVFFSWLLLFCFVMGIGAARGEGRMPFRPSSGKDADRQALSLFCECAFHPEYGPEEECRLHRWQGEITVWAGGNPTQEDLAQLDAFLMELGERVTGLPAIRRVRQDRDAAIRVWYIPQHMMKYYLEGYVEGNWGFFQQGMKGDELISARIGIASDCTEQEERNHLIREELVGALGLPGDHEKYTDSILYQGWTVTQELSDVDWRMLNMLYHPALSPGMTESQARKSLKAILGL